MLAGSPVSIKQLANSPSAAGKAPSPLRLLADRPVGREPVALSDHIMGKRSCRGPSPVTSACQSLLPSPFIIFPDLNVWAHTKLPNGRSLWLV